MRVEVVSVSLCVRLKPKGPRRYEHTKPQRQQTKTHANPFTTVHVFCIMSCRYNVGDGGVTVPCCIPGGKGYAGTAKDEFLPRIFCVCVCVTDVSVCVWHVW